MNENDFEKRQELADRLKRLYISSIGQLMLIPSSQDALKIADKTLKMWLMFSVKTQRDQKKCQNDDDQSKV